MTHHDAIPDGIALTAFDDEFHSDPYTVYERLRRLDPVHHDQVSFYPDSWTIADYESVNALLKDKRLSSDPRSIGLRRDPRTDNPVTLREPDMMNLDDPAHQRLRALVQKAFTPSSVADFTPQIQRIIAQQLEQIDSDPFDVVTTLSKPIPTIVIAEYIGVNSEDHQRFKQWTDALTLQGYPVPTDAQWAEIVAADAALRSYCEGIVADRKHAPRDDLITRLTQAQENDDTLTTKEIVDMCYLLIGAGNFTTTDLISNSIHLCLQQNLTHRACTLDQAQAIVEECLRFDSPVLSARRFVSEDIEVAGKHISAGSVINLLLGAANHDPAHFPDADQFRCDHTSAAHLSFGRGIHHCLGAPLARLEAALCLQAFFNRFPEPKTLQAKRSRRMDFRGFSELIITTRSPSPEGE